MKTQSSTQDAVAIATDIMRHKTGVVIPICFPEGTDIHCGEGLLTDNVRSYGEQVTDSTTLCLSVDGEASGSDMASHIAAKFGASICVGSVNRGKLHAASNGVRVLLNNTDLEYIAVVDQDGDHFANELLNFVRAAQHIVGQTGVHRVMIPGRRISRHRPLGFLRGELEELADRVLLDALLYNAAVTDRPLPLEYAVAWDEFPDFHSGYKLFSRSIAEEVFLGEPQLAGVPDMCYYRHACEAVMVVEALEHGAYLGIVNRSTLNEQPISTFGLLDRSQLVADKIIWPCKRLNIPWPFIKQWMANHMARLLLNTLAPDSREELAEIGRLVRGAFSDEQGGDIEPILQPLFV